MILIYFKYLPSYNQYILLCPYQDQHKIRNFITMMIFIINKIYNKLANICHVTLIARYFPDIL